MNTKMAIAGLWANMLGLWGWMSWHFWCRPAAIVFWILCAIMSLAMIPPAIRMAKKELEAEAANKG